MHSVSSKASSISSRALELGLGASKETNIALVVKATIPGTLRGGFGPFIQEIHSATYGSSTNPKSLIVLSSSSLAIETKNTFLSFSPRIATEV